MYECGQLLSLTLPSSSSVQHLEKLIKKAKVLPPLVPMEDSNHASPCPHRGALTPAHPLVTLTTQVSPLFLHSQVHFQISLGSCSALPRKLNSVGKKSFHTFLMCMGPSVFTSKPNLGWGSILSLQSGYNTDLGIHLHSELWVWGLDFANHIPPLPLLLPLGSRNSLGLRRHLFLPDYLLFSLA